jgi:hypothetical protein
MEGMKLATPGQTPRARMKHPTLEQTVPVSGHYYIDLRLKAGWAIVPDPINCLLPEYINGASVKEHVPPPGGVEVQPKQRRPRLKP